MRLLSRRQLLSAPLALTSHELFAQSSGGLPPINKQPALENQLKVCFLYVGQIGDGGWTYSHESARKKMEKEFGQRIKTSYIENVPESSDANPILRRVIDQGNKLIFGTAFGFMDSMIEVAKLNPNVKFEHATGYKQATNLRTYDSRMYEGAYLAGVIAGSISKSNILGFVASIPIPETIRNINSFTLGALSVNPNIRTKVHWVNEWYNPDKEANAAQILINNGADVLIQNTDSYAVLKTAQKNKIKAFGWDSDMRHYSPQAHLGSVINNWTNYYRKSINDVLNNSWVGGTHSWSGIKEGTIDIVSLSNDIPETILNKSTEALISLKAGTLKIWKGPIQTSSGQFALQNNQIADDRFLAGMNYFVKGVEGQIPNYK